MQIQKAYEKAKKQANGAPLIECIDIGSKWAFYFDRETEKSAGVPYWTVDKDTGELDILTIPPLENLTLLQNGKRVLVESELDREE